MKKLLLLLMTLTSANTFAGEYITDPVTSSYYITITNSTDLDMEFNALNLRQTFIADPDRTIADSAAIWPNKPHYTLIPAQSIKMTALAVRNHQQGYLDLKLDNSGTSFRVSQYNNAWLGLNPNCFQTGGLSGFACFEDTSLSNSPAVVKFNKVQNISCSGVSCYGEVYLEIAKRNESADLSK